MSPLAGLDVVALTCDPRTPGRPALIAFPSRGSRDLVASDEAFQMTLRTTAAAPVV